MSDEVTNLNDLTVPDLKEKADVLGLEYVKSISKPDLIALISVALGEPVAPAEDPAGKASAKADIATAKGEKKYRVLIHDSEKDKQPVPLGCNGRVVRIQRGKEVVIGAGLLESLKNAKQKILRKNSEDENEWIDVHSYPFSVLGEAE